MIVIDQEPDPARSPSRAGRFRSDTARLPTERGMPPRLRVAIGTALGVGLLVGAWALVAQRHPELILPSPAQTGAALVALVADGKVVAELARTLSRAAVGVGLALMVGTVWGLINGRSAWAATISRPALSTLLALPPVVVVAVGLVWLGPGAAVTRMVIAIVALPLIVVAIQEAIANLDRDLLEMAAVFAMPRRRVLRHIVVPGIASPVTAVVSVVVGQALRVAVMAELLASADGIGAEIALARTNLETADLFAWAAVMITVVILVETLILRPITARANRWRDGTISEERVS